jgi:hypothetical protein
MLSSKSCSIRCILGIFHEEIKLFQAKITGMVRASPWEPACRHRKHPFLATEHSPFK